MADRRQAVDGNPLLHQRLDDHRGAALAQGTVEGRRTDRVAVTDYFQPHRWTAPRHRTQLVDQLGADLSSDTIVPVIDDLQIKQPMEARPAIEGPGGDGIGLARRR